MMDNPSEDPADVIAEAIETNTGGRWRAWVSESGRWWAARSHSLTAAEQMAGCVPFLRAGNSGDLSRLIGEQDQLQIASRGWHAHFDTSRPEDAR